MAQLVKIDFDVKKELSKLKFFERSQFPFLYAKTLTGTAEAARQAVGIQSRRVFKLHGEFIPRNIKKSPALKSDFKRFGFAEAAVFTGRKLDGWMGLQEFGGTKTAKGRGASDKGKYLALPGKGLKRRKFKTKTGKVKKRWSPRGLLKDYIRRSERSSRGSSKRSPFIIRSRAGGGAMIVRRKTKAVTPLEVLYIFTRSANINQRWEFKETVERIVNAVFRKKLNKEWKKEFNRTFP